MSPQASELTTAQLLTRAKAAVACGDHLGAIAAALVAIAETGVAQQTPVKPARRTTKILREAERTTSWIWHNPEFPHGGACVYTWLGDAWYYCAIGDGDIQVAQSRHRQGRRNHCHKRRICRGDTMNADLMLWARRRRRTRRSAWRHW